LGQLEAQCVDQRVACRQWCFELGDASILVDGGRGAAEHAWIILETSQIFQKNSG
jgi:hypothetical protein